MIQNLKGNRIKAKIVVCPCSVGYMSIRGVLDLVLFLALCN